MAQEQMSKNQQTGWVGWIAFASTIMILGGFFDMIFGLATLFQRNIIISSPNNVWLVDLTTWGWTMFFFGVLLILGGLSLMTGSMWARIFVVILASLSAIANFAFIPVYPIWSIMVVVIDVLIIYAVTAHGSEIKTAYE